MFTCPANHHSETPEFCSVCGLEIVGTAASVPSPDTGASSAVIQAETAGPAAAGAGGATCPDCGAPRENHQHAFCEVCGYNFATRAAGSGPPRPYMPVTSAPPQPAKVTEQPAPQPAEESVHSGNTSAPVAAVRWELTLTVDPNLYGTPNPEAPHGHPERKFRLFDRETMIGRAGTDVRVQVPVHGDPGVSRRQCLLIEGPDDSLVLRDLNSANGTRVDGVDVLPGVDTPLHHGSVIAIGGWTSITIRSINAP